jgi:hypothetical protein
MTLDTAVRLAVGLSLLIAVIWRVLYVARQWKDEPNPKERPTHVQLHRVITDDPTAEPNGPPNNAKVVQRYPNDQQDCSTVQRVHDIDPIQARLEAGVMWDAARRWRMATGQDVLMQGRQFDPRTRAEKRN